MDINDNYILRIQSIIRRYGDLIFKNPNIVGIGRGNKIINGKMTNIPTLTFLVKKKLNISAISKKDLIPKFMNGAITDTLQYGEIKPLVANSSSVVRSGNGIEIEYGQYDAIGTITYAVTEYNTKKNIYLLTCNHVINPDYENKLGREVYVSPIFPKDKRYLIGNVSKSVYMKIGEALVRNKVDAGLVLVGPNNEETRKKVQSGIALPTPIKVKSVIKTPKLGQVVHKLGVATGLTKGIVETVDSRVRSRVNNEKFVYFEDQITTTIPSQHGDSGALGYTDNYEAFGILTSVGSDFKGIFCSLDVALKALQVNLLD